MYLRLFNFSKKFIPKISQTERTALLGGNVSIESKKIPQNIFEIILDINYLNHNNNKEIIESILKVN